MDRRRGEIRAALVVHPAKAARGASRCREPSGTRTRMSNPVRLGSADLLLRRVVGRGIRLIGFCSRRCKHAGIAPSAEADRVTLVRRLYFDLTGLPPTPDEVDEFLLDDRPDAYERLVDKLLASPAFGERMATWWFDLVRFANTVGYHGDQEHRITPYRDYVIKSFNDNLPFDQFTIEQLAGDLLPNPTMWQLRGHGLQPRAANDARRRRAGRRVSCQIPGRPRAELFGSVACRLDGLRRMSRSQVRSVHAGRFLQPGGVLCRRRLVRPLQRARPST